MSTIETEKITNTRFREGTIDVLVKNQVSVSGNNHVTEETRYRISETVHNCGIVLEHCQIEALLDVLMRMKVNGNI